MTARTEEHRRQMATAGVTGRSSRAALAGLALCMLLPSLDISIANVALPALERAFGASFHAVQWIVLAYLLASTTLIVSVGRLADLAGHRRLLVGGIALFTAASALCGAAPALWVLIAARAAQGLGAAFMMALSVALVSEIVPKSRTGSAMGLLGTTSAIGTSLGPSLGGVLIAGFGWRTVFLVSVPLGVVSLWLVQSAPSRSRLGRRPQADFDVAGTVLLVATLAAYALAMTSGRGALLLAAAIGTGLLVIAEARAASPLISLATLRDPVLSASLAMSVLVSTVLMATLVVGPFYLSRALGLNAAMVGLTMSAGPIFAALTGVPAGRLVDRFGASRMTIIGLVGIAAGCSLLAAMPTRFGVTGYIAPLLVVTADYALFQAANNTVVMKDVRPDQRGVISGMLSLARNLGLITGTAAMGAVFAAASRASDITAAPADAVAAGMRITFAVAAVLILAAILIAMRGEREPSANPATGSKCVFEE